MQKLCTVYPINISINKFYWLRRPSDLNLRLVFVKHIENNSVTVVQENDQRLVVSKNDLLELDPKNKLFKCLMKITAYRHDQYLKNVLHKLGYNSEAYMLKEEEPLVTTDADIDEETFYREYRNYTKSEGQFCDELMPTIKEVIVTGTMDLNVYQLYKKVCENGGMERITNDQKWKSLFYSTMSKTNVSYTIRTFYKRFLYEFEIMRRGVTDRTNYNYKFNIRDRIFIDVNSVTYYGTVKLRRNRGLNQYYIQFFLWSRENSEWFSEDVLKRYPGFFTVKNHIKRKTRSSKANNLIDDPLTREKHSHMGNRPTKQEARQLENVDPLHKKQDNKYSNDNSSRSLYYHSAPTDLEPIVNDILDDRPIDLYCGDIEDCFSDLNDALIANNLSASMDSRKKREQKQIKKNNILERTTCKRKQKIIKMLQEMDVLDESGKMTEENYMFLSFFNLK